MRKRDLVMLLVAALFATAACESFDTPLTRFQPSPVMHSGTLRITGVALPEVLRDDTPLEIGVKFIAEGVPRIEHVCIRWIRDRAAGTDLPDIYCQALEAEGHPELARSCARYNQAAGYAERVSNLFCMKPVSLYYGPDARLVVRMQVQNIKGYNRMECHITYNRDGELTDSNVVSLPIEVL